MEAGSRERDRDAVASRSEHRWLWHVATGTGRLWHRCLMQEVCDKTGDVSCCWKWALLFDCRLTHVAIAHRKVRFLWHPRNQLLAVGPHDGKVGRQHSVELSGR